MQTFELPLMKMNELKQKIDEIDGKMEQIGDKNQKLKAKVE